jgi:sulfide:quinone oxidoreductase
MDAFDNRPATHTFKVELICIVDTRDSGMYVFRTQKNNVVLPSFVGFHWAKRAFEWNYLRQYR